MVEGRSSTIPIPITMRLRTAVSILACICGTGWACVGQQRLAVRESPVWSTEVLTELARGRSDVTRFTDRSRAGVVFSNDRQLIVYEVDHGVDRPSAQTTAEILRPFVLRLRLLDSDSGKVAVGREERTRGQDIAVFATAAGLLVKTGALVKLFSADLAQDRDVPFAIDRDSRIRISVSASGKTVMLNDVIQDSLNHFHSHFDVLDASTGKARYSWNEAPPLYHDYSISDGEIAAVDFNNHAIVTSDFGSGRWIKVGEPSGRCPSVSMPTLYSDEQLVYGCDKLIAVSTNGQLLMTDSFPTGDTSSDKTTVARDGRFVAVSLNTIEVKKHFLAESSLRVTATHIVVYDLALKKRVLAVNIDPLPKNDYDFALSPDGSKLAILSDRKVSVYSVAGQSVAHTDNCRPEGPDSPLKPMARCTASPHAMRRIATLTSCNERQIN